MASEAAVEIADMVEVRFALQDGTLAKAYRADLAEALQAALPWLAEAPDAGVHRLNLVAGGGGEMLVTPRTRLVLRVPRERAQAAMALAGTVLRVGQDALRPWSPQLRELLPYATLYAHFVAAPDTDEAALVGRARRELEAIDVPAQPVCGRWQSPEGAMVGCSVMLAGLTRAESLRVLRRGVGPHRLLGCGLFVPHKSAAAVGAAG
jgi:CRISPR-associated protein Cas6